MSMSAANWLRRSDIGYVRHRSPQVPTESDSLMALTLEDLKSALWDAANILRGSAVDRTDWKALHPAAALLQAHLRRLGRGDGRGRRDSTATSTRSTSPRSTASTSRRAVTGATSARPPANVGAALSHAMREIERANPDTLYRVFGAADWGNREMLTDEILKDLIEGLSAVSLGNTAVSSDILGDAYEYLIGKFADVTKRKKAGEFYTPRSVVRMMVDILDPKEGETIYDPACGTGGMLLGAIEHVHAAGGDPRTFFGKIYGQEKNLTTSSIARMNLVLHGIEDFQIVREDTLRNPAFTDSSTGGLATFDCVIANPPFSLKEWGREIWEADPWGRAAFGLPPESYGDYAWVQHMVASMAPTGTGRMAVVLPQGALFRKAAEGNIRQALLEQDLIEAVIGLAPNLFYGTGLAACRRGPAARRSRPSAGSKVLIVDASSLFRKGRAQNFLDPEHAEQIVAWVPRLRGRGGPRQGRQPGRDQGGGLDAQHLALRAAAHRRGHPAAARGRRGVQGRARRGAGGRGPPARGADRRRVAQVSAHLTQRELESYLWGAATLLRGLVDAGDYKQYIFPLLFFKRLSDVWDEEYQARARRDRATTATPAPPPMTASPSPRARTGRMCALPRAMWAGRCSTPSAPSRRPTPSGCAGVFGNAPWTDKAQTARRDAQEPDRALLAAHAEPGRRARGRARQRLRVPHQAVRRRQRPHGAGVLHQPHAGAPDGADARAAGRARRIYDPTCGTGGMLISALAEVKRRGGDTARSGLYGQELIHITAAIARMNLVLHGVEDFQIVARQHAEQPRPSSSATACAPSTWCSPIRPTRSRSGTARRGRATPGAATSSARRRRAAPTTPSSSTS